MNYWLFQIMYDRFPESWREMLKRDVAAQHYPPGWNNEKRSINKLKELKEEDCIIAAFKKHRFAGYGKLTSDFRQKENGMKIFSAYTDKGVVYYDIFEFQEHFECEWVIVPLDKSGEVCIDCRELKARGHDTTLDPHSFLGKINKKSFEAIKQELDASGAIPAKNYFASPRNIQIELKNEEKILEKKYDKFEIEAIANTIGNENRRNPANQVYSSFISLSTKIKADYTCKECGRYDKEAGIYFKNPSSRLFEPSNVIVVCDLHSTHYTPISY